MRNENYIQIQGWMINEFHLKGNELLAYAIIYGFSQDGETVYMGSSKYIADALQVSRPTAIKALDSLTEKELIIKYQETINDVVFNRYKISLQAIKKLDRGYKETLQGGYKETLQGGYKDSLHSNTNKGNTIKNTNRNIFTPPTIEDVKAYCHERHNNVDAERFIDYYQSKGWMIGKNKMKDWKASVRTWERNNFSNQPTNIGKNGIAMDNQQGSILDEIF